MWRPAPEGVNVLAVAINTKGSLIAVSYQNGDVRLYRYPCVSYAESLYCVIPGVATHCSRLAFSSDGRFLVVLDSFTRAVLQFGLDPL